MTEPLFCRIRVNGHLSSQWIDWFDGLMIENRPDGEAVLFGSLPDQAALYGVLNRMRDLGLELISLDCDKASQSEVIGDDRTADGNWSRVGGLDDRS